MTRTDVPARYDERSVLLQMLRYTQQTAVEKVVGLDEAAARHAPLPNRHDGHLDIRREMADGSTGD